MSGGFNIADFVIGGIVLACVVTAIIVVVKKKKRGGGCSCGCGGCPMSNSCHKKIEDK